MTELIGPGVSRPRRILLTVRTVVCVPNKQDHILDFINNILDLAVTLSRMIF